MKWNGTDEDKITEYIFVDTVSPEINKLEDVEVVDGETSRLEWTPTDNSGKGYYTVMKNGTELMTGEWNATQCITVTSVLLPGLYVYNITVWDEYNNTATDEVKVRVIEEVVTQQSTPEETSEEETTPSASWMVMTLGLSIAVILKNNKKK